MDDYFNKNFWNVSNTQIDDPNQRLLKVKDSRQDSQSSFQDYSISSINSLIESFTDISLQPSTSRPEAPYYWSTSSGNNRRTNSGNNHTTGYHSLNYLSCDSFIEPEDRVYELFPSTSTPIDRSLQEVFPGNSSYQSALVPVRQSTPIKLDSFNMSFPVYRSYQASVSPVRSSTPNFEDEARKELPKTTICCFCRKNNERPAVYLGHRLRTKVRNKKVISCPILRAYVCPACGATGDNAHTIAYCPLLKKKGLKGVPSVTVALKNTKVQSKGTRRL